MSESNHSGKFLEQIFRRELSERGFLFKEHSNDANNMDMFVHRVVVCNAPYPSLYDDRVYSRSEFLIIDGMRKIRSECRWQEVPGSVDEKFPYLLECVRKRMPEREVLILIGGGGARETSIRYLIKEAAKILEKRVHVVTINNFLSWVKRELVRAEAA